MKRRAIERRVKRIAIETDLVNAFHDFKTRSVVLVERDAQGKISQRSVAADYCFFVKENEFPEDIARLLRDSEECTGIVPDGNGYLRIKWANRDLCKLGIEGFRRQGVPTYDGDVNVVRRYLVESGRRPAMPRLGFFDIETDSRVHFDRKEDARILVVAITDWKTGNRKSRILEEDTDDAERELLEWAIREFDSYDQLAAWNGDRFDFEMMVARCRRLGVNVDFRRWLLLDQMVNFEKQNAMAAESGSEKISKALDHVARELCGEGKSPFDASKTWEAFNTPACESPGENGCMKCRECMGFYCERDSWLQYRIEQKTGYIALLATIAEACGTFADTWGIKPTGQVESFLFNIAKPRGFRFQDMPETSPDDGQYRGAYVLHPTRSGIVKSVHICDFASLYPSIIQTWNISPETLVTEKTYPRPENVCEVPITGEWFRTDVVGILPQALGEMIRMRKFWQEEEKKYPPNTPEFFDCRRKSTAYKIAANSFYGVIGSIYSRFFDRRLAESVTQAGVWLIKLVMHECEERGWSILAGDTDSAMVVDTVEDLFRGFVDQCNTDYIPEGLRQLGVRNNKISLAYEKEFERMIIPIDDKDGAPLAKKYAGRFSHYKGKRASEDSRAEVKGLEFKRGDSSRMARELQSKIIDMLVVERQEKPDEILALCERYRKRVLEEELGLDDLMVSKSLGKPLDQYVATLKKDGTPGTLPEHVRVAHMLKERGQDVGQGTKIAYVMVDATTKPKTLIPVQDFDGTYDRFHFWEIVVWPTIWRVVAACFPEEDWDAFNKVRPSKKRKPKNDSQQGLFEWLDKRSTAAS